MPSTTTLFHAKLFLQPSTDVIWVFRKNLGEIPWRCPLFAVSLWGSKEKGYKRNEVDDDCLHKTYRLT